MISARALFAAIAAAAAMQRPDGLGIRVDVRDADGEQWCSVHAQNAPLNGVVAAIAERAGYRFEPTNSAYDRTLVTAELATRPLLQTLDYVVGSAGLRAIVHGTSLTLRPAIDAGADAEQLYDEAVARYLQVMRDFPAHAAAEEAEKTRAEVEEQRGHVVEACTLREAFVDQHVDSSYLPDVLAPLARQLMRSGKMEEAVVHLQHLLRVCKQPQLVASARFDLATCYAHMNQFTSAVELLDKLDDSTPADNSQTAVERRYLRARCLAGLGSGAEALEILDALSRSAAAREHKVDALEIRAMAQQVLGDPAKAARAWLELSREVDGDERAHAMTQAARLAFDASDDLGVLFVERLAARDGAESDELTTLASRARARLAIDGSAVDASSVAQRIDDGEHLVAAGFEAQAFDLLKPIAQTIEAFEPSQRVRFSLAYARCLAREINLDAALAFLRSGLATVGDADARRKFYVLAGELLERENRLDEAIEAYRGRL